ncbi:hypothetical protein JCM10213_006418 [Rhodosporidiobolus nylandii]
MPLSRISRMFKREDKGAKEARRATEERERKVGERQKRMSRQQLSDWELKHEGTASGSSDEKTLADTLEKGRTSGSGSTFLSTKSPSGARSIDFLPRIDLHEFGGGSQLVHTPPTPPMPLTAAKRASTMSSRPVLATIQPSESRSEWNSYLSARKVGVASQTTRASRASRTLSMHTLSALSGDRPMSPQIQLQLVDDDDDDDLPLAVAATRTRSSPALPRPSTMYDISPTLPSASSPNLPRSHSRATSLAMNVPSVLAPVTPPLPSAHSPQASPRPGSLAAIGRRATLIDLTEPSNDPYNHNSRRRDQSGEDSDRIVVGDRRKREQQQQRAKEEKKRAEGPKIMDFSELEDRHKKRMSMLQTTANDHVAVESAKKRFQQQQQQEAAFQRKKEAASVRRQSMSSNLYLAAETGNTSKSSDPRRRSTASISGLSALLKLGNGAPPPPTSSSSTSPRLPAEVPVPYSRSRRSSTQALVSPVAPSHTGTSNTRPPRPTLKDKRRHSLGTLLEVSMEQSTIAADLADLAPPQRPFVDDEPVRDRPATPQERVEKVNQWRARSASPQRKQAERTAGKGEAELLQKAAAASGEVRDGTKKKKNDWLAY